MNLLDTHTIIGKISVPLSSVLAFVPSDILSFGGKIFIAVLLGIITITAQEVWKKRILSKVLKDKE